MRTWISYLVDVMAPYRPSCTFDISEKAAPRTSLVVIWRPDMGPIRPGVLYLCLNRRPEPGTPVPEDTWFVVGAGAEAEHLPQRIVLEAPPEETTLYAVLLDACGRCQAWTEELVRLALSKAEPQALLDASEGMLVNPVLLLDASYNLIAISKSASVKDYPFFDFGGTLCPTPEFLFHMQRESTLIRIYDTGGEDTCVVTERDGAIDVHYRMVDGGDPFANVTSAISRTRLTQGALDLFWDFCRYLRHSLNISDLRLIPSSNVNFALEQIIKFGKTRAMRELLSPREGWEFMTAVLRPNKETPGLASFLAQIQRMLPHSAACLYNGEISMVFCVGSQDSSEVFWQYQYQRLEALAEALDGLFGLSYRIADLRSAGHALEQSRTALELPMSRGTKPEGRLRFYEDVAVLDLTESFFTDERIAHYLPPEIDAIYRADLQNGQNNCELLFYYLFTGRSLAAVAEVLHMHRSTVVYRLERLKELYGLQLDRPERNQLYILCCLSCIRRERRCGTHK